MVLTNTLKHAGSAETTLRVLHHPDRVEIEVLEGSASPGGAFESGARAGGDARALQDLRRRGRCRPASRRRIQGERQASREQVRVEAR